MSYFNAKQLRLRHLRLCDHTADGRHLCRAVHLRRAVHPHRQHHLRLQQQRRKLLRFLDAIPLCRPSRSTTAGGIDTLDASRYSTNQTIDLAPGAWSSIGGEINIIGISLTTTIENAKGGTLDDTILGNNAANSLYGGSGNDTLTGVDGNDSL